MPGLLMPRPQIEPQPSVEMLHAAGERILAWWNAAYLRSGDPVLPPRFTAKACASLPGLAAGTSDTEGVRTAMDLQRTRLRQGQGAPECVGRAATLEQLMAVALDVGPRQHAARPGKREKGAPELLRDQAGPPGYCPHGY